MAAADLTDDRDNPASPIALREDVFDRLTAALGATTDVERARLIKVDRTTLYRWRTRRFTPSFELAARIAKRLGTTVDELFEEAA